MVDAFGEVSFLTRSENRVAVLGTLADGAATERELVEATGISDVTLGRIVEDFRARGWVVETDAPPETGDRSVAYETTPLGDLLAEEYADFSAAADLAARLGPVADLLPLEEMADRFDLRLLAAGRVSDPETFDSLRAVDRWKALLERSDRVVGTAPAATANTIVAEAFHEAVVEEGLSFRVVVSRAYYERASAHEGLRPLLRELLRSGAEMYRSDHVDDFTANVANFDEVATVTGYDEAGNLRVGVETRADPVHEWVREVYERHRADATALTVEDFAEPP